MKHVADNDTDMEIDIATVRCKNLNALTPSKICQLYGRQYQGSCMAIGHVIKPFVSVSPCYPCYLYNEFDWMLGQQQKEKTKNMFAMCANYLVSRSLSITLLLP